ncbi:response regulator transcription factor [Paeniglutamicibacter sulfureus]|uniref:response regulator n=1 Tax=Paeniglutamicibacter sulfureus TaxID=43666 RepID=UPI0026657F5A|nr:response regulator transcription factor [Paeniglutamicibacter sulfureus]MDO2933238.1 response regulator transcription factor [Paeniglutamicibacter sulfureus]
MPLPEVPRPASGPGDRPITVLLADDEALVRAGVRAILSSDPGIEVVAEAADGRQALELAARFRPSVALLDIRMPVLDGLAAARELAVRLPGTAVAMLTVFGEDEYIDAALKVGVSGFLLKASAPQELIAGVKAVASGAAYLSPRVARRVVDRLRAVDVGAPQVARAAVAQLSARETDVLILLGAGYSNAQIGARLHLTEGTVKGHVSAILLKLGAVNRVQAAVLAHHAGLVPPGS